MANTYTLIASETLSTSASSVTFSSIPATYTDLVLRCSVRISTTGDTKDAVYINLNNDTTGNLTSNTRMQGEGTAASSARSSGGSYSFNFVTDRDLATSNTFGSAEIYIPNYAGSADKVGSVFDVAETNASTGNWVGAKANLWRSTSAITSIVFSANHNLMSGSSFFLYGIKSAAVGAYATGGVISQTATHWIHSFFSTGTFTPTQALTADYLVVAGGGGGGGSGGGAGGLRCTVGATGGGGSLESALSLTSGTAYTITVGAGGPGSANGQSTDGTDGYSSSITGTGLTTITSTGGGAGVSVGGFNRDGRSGGSGSGGSRGGSSGPGPGLGGSASPSGQGNAGGNSFSPVASTSSTGGGGGAGAVGGTPVASDTAGNGGNGVTTSISGSSVTYGGGGGGGIYVSGSNRGAGGSGGGGNGASDTLVGSTGAINLGGGGGGAYSSTNKIAYSGGSGIVIIRYAK